MKNIFQVEFYGEIDINSFWVNGRFIEGDVLNIGDIFTTFKDDLNINEVNYKILDILIYKKSIPTIDIGMTGRIILLGKFSFIPKKSFELICNNR